MGAYRASPSVMTRLWIQEFSGSLTGMTHAVVLDPFWVSRRADAFDQHCR
jgi:hypothetical protein